MLECEECTKCCLVFSKKKLMHRHIVSCRHFSKICHTYVVSNLIKEKNTMRKINFKRSFLDNMIQLISLITLAITDNQCSLEAFSVIDKVHDLMIWWWFVFVVWLTDERRLALFPAGTIVRSPHHRESPAHREQDMNLRTTWVQALLNEVVQ